MKKNTILLSYPFSGSIYAFFNDRYYSKQNRNFKGLLSHPYYNTLFGSKFKDNKEISLTLLSLYDQVILMPADSYMPDSQKYSTNGYYHNQELGLISDWNIFINNRDEIEDKIKLDIENPIINKVLWGKDNSTKFQILRDIRTEMKMSEYYNCPILSTGGRLSILKCLISNDQKEKRIPLEKKSKVRIIDNYFKLCSLTFNPKGITDLYTIKTDCEVKKYANNFLDILEDFKDSRITEKKLLNLIKIARDNESLCTKVSGIARIGTLAMSAIGYIFPPAKIAKYAGKMTKYIADQKTEQFRWYRLGFRIQEIMKLKEFDQKLVKFR